MADRNRRFTFAAIALPFLFVLMSGLARAATIIVNTTDGESPAAPLCSLPDAITAHNIHAPMNGCPAGSSNDTIFFAVTGTISIDEQLEITSGSVTINGPIFGCSGAGPCGITIDGEGSVRILEADASTSVTLNNLAFQHGFANGGAGTTGGAILANGSSLAIANSTFDNNLAGTGGGVLGGSGTVTIINSTFADNTAIGAGGAIFNSGSTMSITNCTFFKNEAAMDAGGGLAWAAGFKPSVKSTILVSIDPTGTFDDSDNCQAPGDVPGIVIDGGFNISDDETCFSGATSSLINTALDLDATGLENNGGPTATVLPESLSPAIDFVPIASCTDFSSNPVTTDQRLFGRPDPANLNFCDAGAVEVGAIAPFTLNSERVQIARSSSPNLDDVNIGITFTENGDPGCDLDEDALNSGVGVSLFAGTCASIPNNGLSLFLDPFVVHTVNHQSYGTLFETDPPFSLQQSSEEVSARLVALHTPANTCGQWTLNLEVSHLNTGALGLGGGNPFALVLSDNNGDGAGCFDITNAVTGSQIAVPAHSVRRGVRRQTRR